MTFGVDTGAMASAASKVGFAAEQIDVLLSRIRNDVNEMLGGWSGPAATAHKGLHERFDGDVVTINKALREMQVALQKTHQLYTQQEAEQTGDHNRQRNEIA